MRKTIKISILAITFSAIICIASLLSFNFFAEASETERTVVDTETKYNVTWTLYDDGELCIEGNGQLSYPNRTTNILDKVEKLTIGKGINSLSYMGIPEFKNLKSIQIEEGNTGFFLDDFGVLFSSDNKLLKFPAASEISEYIIPDFAVSVYSNAFINAENLTKVSGGNNVETMGSDVFKSCTKLKDVALPSKLTKISSMFENCTSLESITIPSSVTSIGHDAFSDCTSLSTVIFKENSQLTYIATTAFKNTAYSNDPANWDNGFLYLGSYLIAAKENDVSENCKLYSKTVLIANEVFSGFKKITSVYIPNGTKHIGNSCFSNCPNLISVRLPVDLIEIGSYAFNDCTSLKEIEIPSGVKTLSHGIFSDCSSLEKVTLHDGLEVLESCAFEGTTSLKEIYIPKTVTSIASASFESSGITDIYFGGSKADWKRATQNKSFGNITIHYTLESDDKSVMIIHTDDDFDYEAGNVHLKTKELDKITSKISQNGFYNRLMANPIQILDIKLVDNDENNIQPLEGHKITVKIKASEEFMELMKSGLSDVSEYDIEAENINFINDCFIFESDEETVCVSADESFLKKFMVVHWYSDAVEVENYENFTHDEITVENGYIILETSHFSEYAVCTELVEFENQKITLEIGQTTKLNVTAEENAKLNFESSDNKVVTVDSSGNIKAIGSGKATVTVTIDGTSISSTCTVSVPARKFTVTWSIDGTTTTEDVYENDAIPSHTAPNKVGFVFVGWSPEIPEKMPNYPLTFTAVYEKIGVTSIEIISLPAKTNYTYKIGSLDLSGIVIKAVYSDGTSEVISDTAKIAAHGFTLNSVGTKEIVIEYGGCTAKFQITVSYSWWQQIIRFLLLGLIWY